MNLSSITVLILTWNEAPNLRRTLEQLAWATRVVIIDSESTDETLQIAREFSNVNWIVRPFTTHTEQWNFGVHQTDSEWILALDADYVLTPEFIEGLRTWNPSGGINAAFARFKYCVHGQTLSASLYPPRAVLFRLNHARYVDDGHTQLLEFDGQSTLLNGFILHDDRKPLSRWLWAQDNYARLEAKKLLNPAKPLRTQDRLRLWIVPAPFVVLFYTLFVKGVILDGWPGWFYAFQRMVAELILSLHLIEAKWSRSSQR